MSLNSFRTRFGNLSSCKRTCFWKHEFFRWSCDHSEVFFLTIFKILSLFFFFFTSEVIFNSFFFLFSSHYRYDKMDGADPFVTFPVEVHTTSGKWVVSYRFSAFERLHRSLVKKFGGSFFSFPLFFLKNGCSCWSTIFLFLKQKTTKSILILICENKTIAQELPELPPKFLFGNFDKEKLKQRQISLENYLNQLLKLPFLVQSEEMMTFLLLRPCDYAPVVEKSKVFLFFFFLYLFFLPKRIFFYFVEQH